MPRPVHFELNVADPARAVEFYGAVFGWTFQQFRAPGVEHYYLADTAAGGPEPEGINGAIGLATDGKPATINTIAVEDIDDALTRVTAQGGRVTVARHAIPGIGWNAYCTDPTGLVFGLHQADESAA